MSAQKVSVDKLADAIMKELEGYSKEVDQGTKEIVKEVATDCAKEVKQNAASAFGGGKYSRGWRSKVVYETSTDIRCTVHNSTNWQLAHLLEFGHKKWLWGKETGGYVSGRSHIRPAEEHAEEKLINKATVRFSR